MKIVSAPAARTVPFHSIGGWGSRREKKPRRSGAIWASNRAPEATGLLAPVYRWFTAGFDTGDLHGAKGILRAIGLSWEY
jgi:hypothetical protein